MSSSYMSVSKFNFMASKTVAACVLLVFFFFLKNKCVTSYGHKFKNNCIKQILLRIASTIIYQVTSTFTCSLYNYPLHLNHIYITEQDEDSFIYLLLSLFLLFNLIFQRFEGEEVGVSEMLTNNSTSSHIFI